MKGNVRKYSFDKYSFDKYTNIVLTLWYEKQLKKLI